MLFHTFHKCFDNDVFGSSVDFLPMVITSRKDRGESVVRHILGGRLRTLKLFCLLKESKNINWLSLSDDLIPTFKKSLSSRV